jgi:hypothetical protein
VKWVGKMIFFFLCKKKIEKIFGGAVDCCGSATASGDKTCWCKEENVRVICGKAQLLPGKMADCSSGHREPVNYPVIRALLGLQHLLPPWGI